MSRAHGSLLLVLVTSKPYAIRHARSIGGSSLMAGEEWREGGARAPHGQTKYKLSSSQLGLRSENGGVKSVSVECRASFTKWFWFRRPIPSTYTYAKMSLAKSK